ncbi:HK97 family phage prohead protease [Roseibacterium beibuensis]|uniref:HK97 family phage prohead protease n=1 Tax=[Roseibacterium] beibuensis TaxID=1193142 RepID=UPI00217DB096|nr:HK97 family phage prohead protease [Roseibacterium beibuensis]MCS6622782.1 HK97 family phage prohead protease [Roseibacterium beibuensis]
MTGLPVAGVTVDGDLALTDGSLPIEGYASLWGVADLNGDVVARGAFRESLVAGGAQGVRMLHQHESRSPVGVWDEMREDDRGLWVRGRIMDWSAEARFAQALARAGALDGLSIGFRSQRARREGRLRVLVEVELWEVSLVTFPMLPGARFGLKLEPASSCRRQTRQGL